ncbi:hypothetical protein INR49_023297 [Caranx melampygus]|nr:hypothetical protein INR49_023297 [Caranx melampygus]
MPLVEDSLSERGTSVSFPRSWEREQWTSTEEKLNVGTFWDATAAFVTFCFLSFLPQSHFLQCPPLALLNQEASTTTCRPVESFSATAMVPVSSLREVVLSLCANVTWATVASSATIRSMGR